MSKVDDSAHGMNMLTTPKMEEEEPLVFSVPVDSENKSKVRATASLTLHAFVRVLLYLQTLDECPAAEKC